MVNNYIFDWTFSLEWLYPLFFQRLLPSLTLLDLSHNSSDKVENYIEVIKEYIASGPLWNALVKTDNEFKYLQKELAP